MAIHVETRAGSARGAPVPQLQILEDHRVVLAYQLTTERTVIGRSDEADLALPSDTVSRRHCVVERRGEAWWVVDQSRHGTVVDGDVVQESALVAGSVLRIGDYEVRFVQTESAPAGHTVTRMVRPADHEELVDLASGGVTRGAELVVVDGPHLGATFPLDKARMRVGGRGAHVVLASDLPSDALVLRVVRGRVMVEPGARPVFLGGQRVRDLTPLEAGDHLRLGDHVLDVRPIYKHDRPKDLDSFGDLVGTTAPMRQLFERLERVARHDATVLLFGESGTGKELAARALHDSGARFDQPFVAVNCAAIPANLVESELFGHEAGAFTGATKRHDGAFQRADGGTLFLDELGEMPMDAQVKLLRALETGEVRRVGAAEVDTPDVRVIAATHRNLSQLTEEGAFRHDLLYRLAVLTVHMPPLRAHAEDVGATARILLSRHHPGATLDADAVAALSAHPWPGNVRELRNVLTRAVVLHGPRIRATHLSFDPFAFEARSPMPSWSADQTERERLRQAVQDAGGNRTEAARVLGLPRTSLLYKLRKHGLG